ncbi:MAG: hypothetical protein ACJARZ_001466 [Dokdonia sp.]|jgi:hypothetical protein
MKKAEFHRKTRKTHRWMGILLGIQFLFWTIGGLYFSWSDMDEIHGDHQKAHTHPISGNVEFANLAGVFQKLKEKDTVNYVFDTRLVQILGEPTYQIIYSQEHDRGKRVQLADAVSGELRDGLTKEEAVKIAKNALSVSANVKSVEYLTSTNGHHEYREQPLPAFAVTFDLPSNTTVYVASEFGTVQRFRNNKWRVFDFLWMMHTMDYESRDNLSNWLLRAFSIFGLLTIISGFTLFFISRKKTIKLSKS